MSMKSDALFIILFYCIIAIVMCIFLNNILEDIFHYFNINNTHIYIQQCSFTVCISVVSVFIIITYISIINKKSKFFFMQCLFELKKSHWPTFHMTQMNTIIVILISFIFSVILGCFDLCFSWLINLNLY